MFSGEKINNTEKRSVLHVALRSAEEDVIANDADAVKGVHSVLKRIENFTQKVRTNEIKGYSGKNLQNVVAIGIGGSYLGPEFVYSALR